MILLDSGECSKNCVQGETILAYEFYVYDEMEGLHSIGILAERRTDPLRITHESIMKWGKMLACDNEDVNNICFVQIKI